MSSAVFKFKQFNVSQHPNVFKVGTDAVLLGALAQLPKVDSPLKILEIGSGTGIVSLMLAQRFQKAHLTAIEISEEAFQLSERNFLASPFSGRLKATHGCVTTFKSDNKYNLIVSNPPYFSDGTRGKLAHARHATHLTFETLISSAKDCLSTNGLFTVIIPYEALSNFTSICVQHNLSLVKKTIIKNKASALPKRVVASFSTQFSNADASKNTLIIRNENGDFSNDYTVLTKDFHPFL